MYPTTDTKINRTDGLPAALVMIIANEVPLVDFHGRRVKGNAVVVVLGPAIRRFGETYERAVFQSSPEVGSGVLRLLDIAYYLVFAGYVLMTTRLAPPTAYEQFEVGRQIREASLRVGGLLLEMGVLHALTLVALPMIAFVANSTRTGRRLPRWVVIILIAAAIVITLNLPVMLTFGLGE